MNALRSRLNWLIIPILVLGMGTAGVSNCLQFSEGCRTSAAFHQKARVCSCNGHCHGQCGMACCQRHTPNSDQLPAGPKPHEDTGPSLPLASILPAAIDFASAEASRHGNSGGLATSGVGPSLLALSIRINV